MSYDNLENSVEDGEPKELYLFTYAGMSYAYTSSQDSIQANINGISYTFSADYIKRSDSLKLGASDGTVETSTVEVSRTNNVALLYQGSPPELDTVTISLYSFHADDPADIIRIMYGEVSQVTFNGSIATMTITIEDILNKTIPRGTMGYYCQNCIYDNRCKLVKEDWKTTCYVDGGFSGLWVYSTNLNEKESGYFTDGYIKMGNSFRAVSIHLNGGILLKYPINAADKSGSFEIYPGCSNIFKTCALKFNNTLNFTGVPYCAPIDAVKNRVFKGSYWIDDTIITRDSGGFVGSIAGV